LAVAKPREQAAEADSAHTEQDEFFEQLPICRRTAPPTGNLMGPRQQATDDCDDFRLLDGVSGLRVIG
jgi:hypothetical protein